MAVYGTAYYGTFYYGEDVPAEAGPSVADVPALLATRGYTIERRLYRATIDNTIVEDISDLLMDGTFDMNLDRDVKLSATFNLRSPDRVAPYTDFLAPYVHIRYRDGRPDVDQQCGLFATKVSPGAYTKTDATGTVQGADLTSVLGSWYYANGSSNPAGFGYGPALQEICENGGIARTNIPDTAATLPTTQSFKPGSTRLEKGNTYLDQLGWYHFGMDLDGKISTLGPPRSLAAKEPWRVLTDADVIGAMDVQPTGFEIANVVIVVNDNALDTPMRSKATNDDPSSPTSTVAIGRAIMRLVTVSGSTTQAALDALAARYLDESRTFYRIARLTLLHDPAALVMHQVIGLDLSGERSRFNGRWFVRTASMGMAHDKPLVIECNQISDDLNEVVI